MSEPLILLSGIVVGLGLGVVLWELAVGLRLKKSLREINKAFAILLVDNINLNLSKKSFERSMGVKSPVQIRDIY